MNCPHCGYTENRVLDTRIQKEGDIRRRRECMKCKTRFSTVESILVNYPHVKKKDGRREPFSKEKLRRGIQIACKKRPVSIAEIESSVAKIAKWAQNRGEKEMNAKLLGQIVMSELKELDDVAYVRFASVYKTFKDIHEFVESLETTPEELPPIPNKDVNA
ncbi:MAG: transcriptional repressor NrdR [Bdellovibrionales bacterium]|nr:transcriptional repressor NrdR [Bdellovibrionales bacterium]